VDGAGFGYDRVPFAILEKGKPVPELSMRSKTELAQDVVNLVKSKREALGA
jgi:phosphopantothenoylcysteine decarboxylase/phosphopantothenate--cysteine ligase